MFEIYKTTQHVFKNWQLVTLFIGLMIIFTTISLVVWFICIRSDKKERIENEKILNRDKKHFEIDLKQTLYSFIEESIKEINNFDPIEQNMGDISKKIKNEIREYADKQTFLIFKEENPKEPLVNLVEKLLVTPPFTWEKNLKKELKEVFNYGHAL